jgi:tetratricopeptide (TPR) repeat protein
VRRNAALFALAGIAACLAPGVAFAESSRWAKVADPELYGAEAAAAEAERELIKATNTARNFDDLLTPSTAYAMKARIALMEARATQSRFPRLRLFLARAEQQLGHFAEAALLYESVVRDNSILVASRGDAWADLAIVYAHLKRVPEEIEAEETALAFEPNVASRSTILANQAEAFMGTGDVSRAIAGYRAGLEGLTTFEMMTRAPTTLYSLGVALDRSGDLEGGLEAVARARSYDPSDRFLQGDAWFFSTPHDAAWFEALGHWLVARRGDGDDVRLGAYERAVAAWRSFVSRAPETDPYLGLAKARLKLCEKEFAAFSKKVQTPTPIEPRKRRGPVGPDTD